MIIKMLVIPVFPKKMIQKIEMSPFMQPSIDILIEKLQICIKIELLIVLTHIMAKNITILTEG